jgi:diguanylate cyclase (GGDEF)-like protein
MFLDRKNRKRLLIFSAIPVLAIIPFVTDDVVLRIIAAVLLVIYVGFIIFLRDSMKSSPRFEEEGMRYGGKNLEKGFDEKEDDGFEIIAGNLNAEIVTAGDPVQTVRPKTAKEIYNPGELKSEYIKIAKENLPENVGHDEYFSFVLEKMLKIAQEAFFAYSAVFFWYNRKGKRITLHRAVSASNDIAPQKYDLENDVLSEIAKNEEPKLLPSIPPTAEMDNIRYYSVPQGIRSFVGVPVFYGDMLVGVLALDSREEDSFSVETVYSLGRLARIISIIISLFDEKFAETLSEQRLKALLSILASQKTFGDAEELYETIETSVASLLHWDAFSFVYYDPLSSSFKTTRVDNKRSIKYVGEGLEIDLKKSLTGKAILTGSVVSVEDTTPTEEKRYIRFAEQEDISYEGAFLAVPLVYHGQNFGALCFDNLKKSVYSSADINFIQKASKIFAFIAYAYSTQKFLRNLLSVDVETKIFNRDFFLEMFKKDLLKAKELNAPGALALIHIDEFLEQENLFEGDPFPKVLKAIVEAVKEVLPEKSFFGRISERLLAVSFFNFTSNDAFLWAEKLRIKVARTPVPVMSRQSTFTISIGLASTNNRTDWEEIFKTAQLALNKALEKGGNAVKSAT